MLLERTALRRGQLVVHVVVQPGIAIRAGHGRRVSSVNEWCASLQGDLQEFAGAVELGLAGAGGDAELLGDFVVLPSESMIGDDYLFLDDLTLKDVEREIGVEVVPSGYTAGEFIERMRAR